MDRKRLADETQGAPLKKMKVECKTIALQANCFAVTVGGEVESWYEYDVKFEPVVGADATRLKRALLHSKSEVLMPTLGDFWLFTGTNLYSPELVAEPVVVEDATSRAGVKYTITITHTLNKLVTAELSQPMKALINTALRRRMFGELLMVDIRRLMFLRTPPGERVFRHATGQVTVLQGYSTAISDDYQAGLHLNIDCKSKVQHLSTLLVEMTGIMKRNQANVEAACNAELEGKVFMTKYARRSYRIERIDFTKTPRDTFKRKNGTELSYLDYYRDTYSERITELDQPLVEVKTRKRRRTDRTLEGQQPAQPEGADPDYEYLYFIPELLYLTGLSTEMRNDAQFKGMVNLDSKLSGSARKAQIESFVSRQLVPANLAETALAKAGVDIDRDMLKLNGFVFSERIVYGDQKAQSNVTAGDWQQEYYKHVPFRGVALTNWIILCPKAKASIAEALKRLFAQAINKGLTSIAMQNPELVYFDGDPRSPASYLSAITPFVPLDPKPQIVLFIMPAKYENVYEEVKAFLGSNGIPQQAVLATTMESGGQPAKATKILAQMACKLGGALWAVEMPYMQEAPTMIVGIDISPDTKKNKNVLGFCATLDPDFSSYFIKVAYFDRQGRQGVDVVSSQLVELLESAIEAFYQKNGNTMPANIVLYRSGVSDGMLHAVVTSEIAPILERLQLISAQSGDPVSKLTYVIVRNRINMRFFYTQGRNGNPTPGTVVDEAVVYKDGYIKELVGGNDGGNSYDFYMCAQNVKEGTVGPTHYIVAYDSIQTDRNEFEHFTFKLCHLYYNWTGTVKIPAPVMYAQKAAKQVAQYLHSVPVGLDEKQWCI